MGGPEAKLGLWGTEGRVEMGCRDLTLCLPGSERLL